MRKNQKYSKDEMYHAIELWKESGLSQRMFCKCEKFSLQTFGYWLGKYRAEKEQPIKEDFPETFIPVELPINRTEKQTLLSTARIEVSFPNGVRLSCPAGIDMLQLKNLINF